MVVALAAEASAVVGTRAEAERQASVSCSIVVDYVFREQDGTVIDTQPYQKDFVVQEGTDFVDDFSTATRLKEFRASVQRVGAEVVVSVNWFADVSVFNSVEFSASLTLPDGRKTGTVSGDHTFSSTPGHATTTYSLVGVRN